MNRWISSLLAFSAVAGCSFISDEDHTQRIRALDEDGDGVTKGDGDCDDRDRERTPGAREIPYDGIDNDCDGNDIVDLDGDGYPVMSLAQYRGQFGEAAPWQAGVNETEVDCADDPDVFPGAGKAYPGKPNDAFYDGFDADCDGGNDFDRDGDGYIRTRDQQAFATYVSKYGLQLTAMPGDCDDTDASAHPDATPEVYYDGVDTDCDGGNDFDQDGDGFMPDRAAHLAAFQAFLQRYHGGTVPAQWGTVSWGDCLDATSADLPGTDPATVYPGNRPETPYDGVDTDCDGSNDFDNDGDGWIRASDTVGLADYNRIWGTDHTAQAGDCDDDDAGANPDQLEVIGDAADSDCDGDPDTAPFRFADIKWDKPRPPRLVVTSEHFVLATSDDVVEIGTPPQIYREAGVAIPIPRDPAAGEAVDGEPVLFHGVDQTDPIGNAIDIFATGSGFTTAIPFTNTAVSDTYVVATEFVWNHGGRRYERVGEEVGELLGIGFGAIDIDLAIDGGGKPWVFACSQSELQGLKGEGETGVSTTHHLASQAGGTCFLEPDIRRQDQDVTLCDGVGCITHTYDGDTFVADVQRRADDPIVFGDYRDGFTVLLDAAGLWSDDGTGPVQILAGDFDAGDLAWVGSTVFAAVTVPDGRDHTLLLAYGDPASPPLTELELTFADGGTTLEPVAVSVAADDQGVAVGVLGTQGSVTEIGWMVLAR